MLWTIAYLIIGYFLLRGAFVVAKWIYVEIIMEDPPLSAEASRSQDRLIENIAGMIRQHDLETQHEEDEQSYFPPYLHDDVVYLIGDFVETPDDPVAIIVNIQTNGMATVHTSDGKRSTGFKQYGLNNLRIITPSHGLLMGEIYSNPSERRLIIEVGQEYLTSEITYICRKQRYVEPVRDFCSWRMKTGAQKTERVPLDD